MQPFAPVQLKDFHQSTVMEIQEKISFYIVLTFLCTSVRMRYSAARSRLAFRLGKTDALNRSGENLRIKDKETPL